MKVHFLAVAMTAVIPVTMMAAIVMAAAPVVRLPVSAGELTHGKFADFSPRYMPDGKNIIFTSNRNKSIQVWSVTARGKTPVRLSSLQADTDPAPSPDGKKIVFASFGADKKNHTFGLWVLEWSGRFSARRARKSKPHPLFTGDLNEGRNPCWSPDGSQIVWTHHHQLWISDLKGTNARALTSRVAKAYEFCGRWSPDGQWIAYLAADKPQGAPGSTFLLWLIKPDGTQQHLWFGIAVNRVAGWSADGRELYLQKGNRIFAGNRDDASKTKTLLTFRGYDGTNVDLSPDRKWLVFDDNLDENTSTGHLFKIAVPEL